MDDPPKTPQQQIPSRYRYRVVTSPRRRSNRQQPENNAGQRRRLVPRTLFQENDSNPRPGLINRPNAQPGTQLPPGRLRLIGRANRSTPQQQNPNVQRRTQFLLPSTSQPQQGRNPPRAMLERSDGFRVRERRHNVQPRPLLERHNAMRNSPRTPQQKSIRGSELRRKFQLIRRPTNESSRNKEKKGKSKGLKPMISRPGASIQSQRAVFSQNVGRMMMMNRMKKAIQKSPQSRRRGRGRGRGGGGRRRTGRFPLLRNSSKDSILSRASSGGGMDPYDRLLIRSQLFEEYEDEASLNVEPRILDNRWNIKLSEDLNEEEDEFAIEENIMYSREVENRPKTNIPLGEMKPVNAFFDEKWGEDEFCEEEYRVEKKRKRDDNDDNDNDNDDDDNNNNNNDELDDIGEGVIGEMMKLGFDEEGGNYMDNNNSNLDFDEEDRVSTFEKGSEAMGNELDIRYFTIMDLRRKESTHALVRFYRKLKKYAKNLSVCCCGRCCRGNFYACNPCGLVLMNVERNFGTGIASFYDLWASIICMNIGIFLTCLFLLIIPWLMRTDLELTEKWSPFIHYKFYLGLLGVTSDKIGDTFFMYSGYTPFLNTTEEITISSVDNSTSTVEVTDIPSFGTTLLYGIPYEFRFFYPVTMVILLFLCFMIIVVSIGKRIRIVNKVDRELKFSTGILSLWDHRMLKKSGILAQRRFITSTFLEYLQMEHQKEKGMKRRSIGKICCLCHRRVIGWTVTSIILIGAPIGVFFLSAFYSTLNSSFPFTSTLIIFAMNQTLPTILNTMVSLENYRSEKVATYNRILRTFVIKTSLLISLIVRTLFTSGEDGECVPTEAGVIFWQLVLVDLIQSVIVAYFLGFGKLVLYRGKKKTEFNIPKNVNLLFYRQSIIWVGTLVSPMLPLLGIFSSMILFLTSYIVMTCTMRFPSKPITNIKGNIFNQTLLFVTLLIVLIPAIVFFVQPGYGCGPAYEEPLVYGFNLKRYITNEDFVDVLETIMEYSPYILVLLLLFSFVGSYLIYQRYQMYYNKYKTSEERVRIERVLQTKEEEIKVDKFHLEFIEKEKFD